MKKLLFVFFVIGLHAVCFAQTASNPELVHYSFPVSFIQNAGQWDNHVLFSNLLGDKNVALLKDGLMFPARTVHRTLDGNTSKLEKSRTRLRFVHPSHTMKAYGAAISATKSNFYSGSDQSAWKENVDNYSTVVYSNVWKNIDVEYGETDGKLTQTFIVKPGGKVSDIRIKDEEKAADRVQPFYLTKAYTKENGKETPVEAALKTGANGVTSVQVKWSDTTKYIILKTEFSSV